MPSFGTLKADTLTHSTAGSLATNFVVKGSAKALDSFVNQVTPALESSLNISSITDEGTGQTLHIHFTTICISLRNFLVSRLPAHTERPKLFGNATTTIRIQNEHADDGTDRDTCRFVYM